MSREVHEFLVDFSVALHRHSMYPAGHPALEPAVAAVVRRAGRLFETRPGLAFGVARRRLLVDGVATDPGQPVLSRLAEALHGHHLGAVSLFPGLDTAELVDALRILSADAGQGGAIGLQPSRLEWPHLRLHPLSFEGLAIVGAPTGTAVDGAAAGARHDLWSSLARVALASDPGAEAAEDPSTLARAIEGHEQAHGYDTAVADQLARIAHDLRSAEGGDGEALRRHVSDLIASLRPETLRRLLEMGGDAARRGAFVRDAVHGMAVDAVVDILRAAGEAGGQTISHGLVRMLAKLAAHAEAGPAPARALAEHALRDQAQALLRDWQLEDPNPEAYGGVLQHLATSVRAGEGGPLKDGRDDGAADPLGIVEMSLETGATGPQLDRSVDRLVRQGRLPAILTVLESPPKAGRVVADAVLARLLEPAMLRALTDRDPLDAASLDLLLPFMYAAEYEVLLDALVDSPSRVTRRKLMDRLARAHVDISRPIVRRLEQGPWYVQRNMLILLERTGRVPAGFSPEPWTRHPDPRVRHEAIRLQLAIPEERDLAARLALDDGDTKIVLHALAAIQHDCPPNFAERVARVAIDPAFDDELRRLAVVTLAPLRQRQALEALLQIVDGGKTLLGRAKLAAKSPVVLAALRALAGSWAADGRARPFLALAADSSDPDVRTAVRTLPA